jgi:VIT1/CCC1 family predicted Fe2+/Mn2+ transporter
MSRTRRARPAGHAEPHGGGMATRLNWLRAAVLGANDGIVSTAGLVVGVAGATPTRTAILTAGLAGLFEPWVRGRIRVTRGSSRSVRGRRGGR